MTRSRNPLAKRNANASFTMTGREISRIITKLGASKRARVVRERGEFDIRDMAAIMRPPVSTSGSDSWSIADIVAARDQQMLGRFRAPQKLAASFSTDDALFTARGVRLAPVQSLTVEIEAGPKGKGDRIADEADALFGAKGVAISSQTDTTIRQHLVDHGVAFGVISWVPRADGSRWDPVLSAWPIEWVWWHPLARCYVTTAQILDDALPMDQDPDGSWRYFGSPQVGSPTFTQAPARTEITPIIHGDGRWVVFRKSELLPHQIDATLLPAAMVWAAHAFAKRDWIKGSGTHGNAKVVGELPDGTPLTDPAGQLTSEAAAFLQLVSAVASMDQPVGIRPTGSKIDYITNPSRAWEVWAELVQVAEKAAARIYLGTDGILGAQGGAPGVDVSQLLGVATSKVQSDLACMEQCVQSGLISPWCSINFGDDRLAPTRRFVFPDPDESRVREDFARRNAAFNSDVAAYRANGFVVDQALVDRIAEAHGVPAPMLPAAPAVSPSAPTSPELPPKPIAPSNPTT